MTVGAIPPVSFFVPALGPVQAVAKVRRSSRGGKARANASFGLPEPAEAEKPAADPAAASTAAATFAAVTALKRGG